MPRLRATLRGKWWQSFFKTIRFCYSCGGRLKRKYVKEEKTNRHVCSKCGQITYLNPKVVAGVIPVNHKGEVLLLRRNIEPAIGRWTYPAGFQELGETVPQAAEREALEEVCVKAKVKKLVGIYTYEDAGVVTIVYVGQVSKSAKPKISNEAQEVGFFSPRKIPWKELAFRSTTEALKNWLLSLKG